MNRIRLTAFPLLIVLSLLSLSACERNAEEKKTTDYEKLGIPMTGAQETPPNTSPALGTMDVFYSKETRVLTYTVNWSGLSGPVTAMHIHGLAPTGYLAGVVQNIITSSGGLATPNASLYGAKGKFSGSFFVVGVCV